MTCTDVDALEVGVLTQSAFELLFVAGIRLTKSKLGKWDLFDLQLRRYHEGKPRQEPGVGNQSRGHARTPMVICLVKKYSRWVGLSHISY